MSNRGYPPQFLAVVEMILKNLTVGQISQLVLYTTWRDSWEQRDPTTEPFWHKCLEGLFDRKTNSGFRRMSSDTVEAVELVGNKIIGERIDSGEVPGLLGGKE